MDKVLLNACMGKSSAGGGLNIADFREEMAEMFPEKADKIMNMNRKQLQGLCKRDVEIREEIKEAKARYFLPGSPLNERQIAYCRCLAHVSAKNPAECYTGADPEWKKGPKSKRCYNMYSVCTKSTKRKGRFRCTPYYDLDDMPADEVKSIAMLEGKTVPQLRKYIEEERRKPGWKNPYY